MPAYFSALCHVMMFWCSTSTDASVCNVEQEFRRVSSEKPLTCRGRSQLFLRITLWKLKERRGAVHVPMTNTSVSRRKSRRSCIRAISGRILSFCKRHGKRSTSTPITRSPVAHSPVTNHKSRAFTFTFHRSCSVYSPTATEGETFLIHATIIPRSKREMKAET